MIRPEFTAGSFFRSRELNGSLGVDEGTGLDRLWDLLIAEQTSSPITETTIRNHTDQKLLFRGQSDQDYGLSSSLHRAVRAEVKDVFSESDLFEAETRVKDAARALGVGKGLTAVELQQLLQHHHAPTRLMDVSKSPLEALYFATEDKDLKDGRLFLINPRESGHVDLQDDATDLPWSAYVRGSKQAVSTWTQAVNVIEGRPLDPRMIAQAGTFLVGGIRRAYSDLNIEYDGSMLTAEELQIVSMLTLGFPKGKSSSMGAGWPALCWTIRIPAAWKKQIRARLAEHGIDHDHMYPAFESLKWRTEAALRSV